MRVRLHQAQAFHTQVLQLCSKIMDMVGISQRLFPPRCQLPLPMCIRKARVPTMAILNLANSMQATRMGHMHRRQDIQILLKDTKLRSIPLRPRQ